MALGKGYRTTAGFKKATTWGTPVEVGALNGIEFKSESLEADVQLIEDEQITGSAQQREGDAGVRKFAGDIVSAARYEGLEAIIAQVFGTAGTPAQQVNRTAADGVAVATDATFTSATAAFAASDVGKRITIAGAGAAGALLDTTILTRTSATEIELAVAASTSVDPATWTIYDAAYKHVFKPANTLEGIFGTLVFVKLDAEEVHEYTTCKVGGMSIKAVAGQRAEVTFRLVAHDLNTNAGSGTNNTTTVASITLPANRAFLQFSQMVCRINGQSGAGLGSGDTVYLSEFNLDIDNVLSTDDVTTQFGNKIDEPVRDGFIKISGSLVFSKYQTQNKTLFTEQMTKARKKMDVKFTGGAADGVTNFAWNLFFPNLQFASGTPTVGGPERIPLTLSFNAYRVLTIPTGFTAGYIDALTMEVVSQQSANPLA